MIGAAVRVVAALNLIRVGDRLTKVVGLVEADRKPKSNPTDELPWQRDARRIADRLNPVKASVVYSQETKAAAFAVWSNLAIAVILNVAATRLELR